MPTETREIRNCTRCADFFPSLTNDEVVALMEQGYSADVAEMCPHCRDMVFAVCSDCGAVIDRRGMRSRTWIVETTDNPMEVGNETRVICDRCFRGVTGRGYAMCNECRRIYPAEWGHCYTAREIQPYDDCNEDCDDCDRENCGETIINCTRCAEQYAFHEWDYKPNPIFHKLETEKPKDNLKYVRYFGLELEYNYLENKRSMAIAIEGMRGGGHYYMKHDGSTENGGEIVTHPFSLGYHTATDYMELFHNIGDEGNVGDNCGLHVHVNKASLGITDMEIELTQAKLLCLMDRLWDCYMVKFSRRMGSNGLRQYASKPQGFEFPQCSDSDWEDDERVGFMLNQAYRNFDRHNRYTALNLMNRKTVEFRLFKTTMERGDIIATLQMIDMLIDFARGNSIKVITKVNDWKQVFPENGIPSELAYYHRKYINDGSDA